jgi:hypothetical protein
LTTGDNPEVDDAQVHTEFGQCTAPGLPSNMWGWTLIIDHHMGNLEAWPLLLPNIATTLLLTSY